MDPQHIQLIGRKIVEVSFAIHAVPKDLGNKTSSVRNLKTEDIREVNIHPHNAARIVASEQSEKEQMRVNVANSIKSLSFLVRSLKSEDGFNVSKMRVKVRVSKQKMETYTVYSVKRKAGNEKATTNFNHFLSGLKAKLQERDRKH